MDRLLERIPQERNEPLGSDLMLMIPVGFQYGEGASEIASAVQHSPSWLKIIA
jgi:hypothetical protein